MWRPKNYAIYNDVNTSWYKAVKILNKKLPKKHEKGFTDLTKRHSHIFESNFTSTIYKLTITKFIFLIIWSLKENTNMKIARTKWTNLQYTTFLNKTTYHHIHHPLNKYNNIMNLRLPPPFWGNTQTKTQSYSHNVLIVLIRKINIKLIQKCN